MPIQKISAQLIAQIKNFRFWLAFFFGSALGLTFYQEVLSNLMYVDSLRLKIVFYVSAVLFMVICFYFFQIIIPPRFISFSRSQKAGVILLSILTPFILAIAIFDMGFMDKTIYFLLPSHTIQVEALSGSLKNGQGVILTGFTTQAQGSLSLKEFKIKGWEIKGNQLVLKDPIDNLITWQGKTGDETSITFLSHSDPSEIKVRWDAAELSYSFVSKKSKNVEVKRNFDIPLYAGWMTLAIAEYLSAVFVIFSLSVVLVAFPGFAIPISSSKKWAWIIYALPMYAVWLFYLFVFWPGFMSLDSMSQWEQVVTGNFIQANPVGHTLTIWLITRFWFSPAAVAIVQILVLGGVLGWGIATLSQFGAPKWLAWLTAIALAISPANSTLSITLWKDILFSAVVVALTILFFKIIALNGAWLNQGLNWLLLGITLVLVSFYRLNGFFVGFISLLITGLIYKKYWKPILKAAFFFLTIYFLFTGPIFRLLNVRVENMSRGELVAAQLLAGHMKVGNPVVEENKELLMPAMPQYPWPYTCSRNSTLFFDSNLDRGYLSEHLSEILRLALKATLQNPLKTLEHFACQSASVYRIPQDYPNEMMMMGIVKNSYGIKPSSLLPELHSPFLTFLNKVVNNSKHNAVWLIWRMPFWMYLSVFSCIIFCIRNKTWLPLLILAPGLLTILPYLVITLGQIFRYLYSMYLIGILLSGYFLVGAFTKQSKGQQDNF